MANACVGKGLKLTPKSRSLLYHLANKRCIGTTSTKLENYQYRFAIAGGGCGGIAIAAKLAEKYGKGKVIIIEPSSVGNILTSLSYQLTALVVRMIYCRSFKIMYHHSVYESVFDDVAKVTSQCYRKPWYRRYLPR